MKSIELRYCTVVLILGMAVLAAVPATAQVWYVDNSAPGPNDGTTWSRAFKTLQPAINAATGAGGEVWVAGGTIGAPIHYTENRTEVWNGVGGSLVMKDNVHLYGGFEGFRGGTGRQETVRSQRVVAQNITVIDGSVSRNGNPAYNVVVFGRSSAPTQNARLDGFHITGGNATGVTGNYHTWRGGGIFNWQSEPVIENCYIYGNTARVSGGGVSNENGPQGSGNATFRNCVIANNTAQRQADSYAPAGCAAPNPIRGGGGVFNNMCSPTFIHVTVANNNIDETWVAPGDAGNPLEVPPLPAVYHNFGMASGGIYNFGRTAITCVPHADVAFPLMASSIVWGNVGGGIRNDPAADADMTITYSDIQGGFAGTGNINSDPGFAGTFPWAYRLPAISPARNAADPGSAVVSDIRGVPRNLFSAGFDMGAYERSDNGPVAVCQSHTVYLDGNCQAVLAGASIDGGSTAEAGVWKRTAPDTPFTGADIGSHQVPLTVYDILGRTDSCNATVEVVDTMLPVVTLLGAGTVVVECTGVYTEPGYTAADNCSGDLTDDVVVGGTVDTATPGPYVLTYDVLDGQGNSAIQRTRTVNVVDTIKPVLTRVGPAVVNVQQYSVYEDQGATAADTCEGDLTAEILTTNPVNTNMLGSYVVTYEVSDSSSNEANPITRTVNVVDAISPIVDSVVVESATSILVTYNKPMDLNVRGTGSYVISGTGRGTFSQNPFQVIEVTSSVYRLMWQTTQEMFDGGDVTITVASNVQDTSGNPMGDPRFGTDVGGGIGVAPVITMLGSSPVVVQCGDSYTDAGATAVDNISGVVAVNVSNPVNTTLPDVYSVVYTAQDAAGNTATEIRIVEVIDTVAPVVTITGGNTLIAECTVEIVLPGATADDVCDGALAALVSDYAGLNTANPAVGVYEVVYAATDSSSNTGTAILTVDVRDTAVPSIILYGSLELFYECGDEFLEGGYSAEDDCDGDLTGEVVVGGDLDMNAVGSYTVTYNVSDSAANAAVQQTRTVHVEDTTIPVITLQGANPMTIECGDPFVDPYTAIDICDGDITGDVVLGGSLVDVHAVGTYIVSYNVSDSADNAAEQKTRTVHVVDTAAPEITLFGDNPMTIECGAVFVDDYAAEDACDGDITDTVVVGGDLDVGEPGVYTVTYNVTDAEGLAAVERQRTVEVVDNAPPLVTIVGGNTLIAECALPLTLPQATALDSCDGALAVAITEYDGLDVNSPAVGIYAVEYSASDASSNVGTATLTVEVRDTTRPVITLNGFEEVLTAYGEPYVDAGASALDACDGDITSAIVVTNPVNTGVVGEYLMEYDVSDAAGISAHTVYRVVNVVDQALPWVLAVVVEDELNVLLSFNKVMGPSALVTTSYSVSGSGRGTLTQNPRFVALAPEYGPEVYRLTWERPSEMKHNGNITITVSPSVLDADGTPLSTPRSRTQFGGAQGEAPVITILGDEITLIECTDTYVDAGATAEDNVDGNITEMIVVIGLSQVNTAVPGEYSVTYRSTDNAGNEANAVRTIRVLDTTSPTIELMGAASIEVECGVLVVDPGYAAWDSCQGDITANVIVGGDYVNNMTPEMTYTRTYSVHDSSGNSATLKTRAFTVVDTTPPVITLNGASPYVIIDGAPYVEPGATAVDACQGNLTASISIGGDMVNHFVDGIYYVTYTVSDFYGNTSVKTRIVVVRPWDCLLKVDAAEDYIEALAGNDVQLEVGQTPDSCSVGVVNFQWKKRHLESSVFSSIPDAPNSGQYVLQNVAVEDTGVYRCTVFDVSSQVDSPEITLIVSKGIPITGTFGLAGAAIAMALVGVGLLRRRR